MLRPRGVASVMGWVVCAVAALTLPARNALAAPPPSPTSSSAAVRTADAPMHEAESFHLSRAVDCWQKGDLRGAAEFLEFIDVTPASTFPDADRAAFLLVAAYLQLQDAAAFERVAASAGSDTGSPYRRWIRYCALAQASAGTPSPGVSAPAAPAGFPGAEIMQASLLLEAGNARAALALLDSTTPASELASIHLYLRGLAHRALGDDPSRDWESLSTRTARSPLEADLIGYAVLELAVASVEQPQRALRVLERMPTESHYVARALHLRSLVAVEAGDTATASATLHALQRNHPSTDVDRDTRLALGAMMMDRRSWYAALRYFESAADEWDDEASSLAHLESGDDLDTIWNVWSERGDWRAEIRLAPEALLAAVAGIAGASLDLRRDPSLDVDNHLAGRLWPTEGTPAVAAWDSAQVLARHTPLPEEWERVRGIDAAVQKADAALTQSERDIDARRRELERRKRYLDLGMARATSSADTLTATIARLDSLVTRLDAALRQLERVRDGALAHVAARTGEMVARLDQELIFMRAIRHFYVDGPQRDRPVVLPPGVPAPAEVLAREEALATQAEQFLGFFAAHYADVIQRSFAQVWRPHLADDSRRLQLALRAERARAVDIAAGVDSTRAALAGDPVLAAAQLRRDRLGAALDSLRTAGLDARREIAAAVAARARTELGLEREAIDYHLADATYELAVQAATDSATAETPDAVAPIRDQAIARVSAFLARYPQSAARGESRYRLADLCLMKAREDFRTRMAGFLGETPSASDLQDRALAPFVNYAPAIEQYQAILRDDPGFPHMDAVLFNLGMILADDGQPDATRYLSRLVNEFPDSPDVQEAWLRMGNERFDQRDFAGAAPLFEHAVAGHDPSFTAMALYKLGWSHIEQDQFEEATDAFARLIDHYNQHADIVRSMDLRDEAEEYLVHSLARSGGAPAFVAYFDRVGHRDYEQRVLASLAYLMRSVSMYGEAAECERVWLSRYPADPGALEVAERLVDTYKRWNKPDLARDAKRAHAELFLPGSAWYRAQTDASVRAAADEFARSAFRETAATSHAQARSSNDPARWRDALAQYEAYLKHWPDANDSPRLHDMAGDVAAHLNDYRRALSHLSATITSDSLSLVHDAMWQRVALTDAWYRRSQASSTGTVKLGTDSLATLVIKTGDEFTARFSSDPHCADVVWRQGNLALAHGRYADAAVRLAGFGERYPADRRALAAVTRSADARYRLSEFDKAGATYEQALALARTAGRDSVVAALETTIPTCYYQHAERVARADSANGERKAAPLFARVARSWPRFAHADLALYRAGLGYAAGGKSADAIAAWEELLRVHPKSEYARDSASQVAITQEKSGDKESAARAYERFAQLYPQDADAAPALLKAADLLATAGKEADAESARTRFLAAYPNETASVMEIRAARAQKDLAAVAAGTTSISALLSKKSNSELKSYLALADQHPELASTPILAQADYLRAEEEHAAYVKVALSQPLPKSIEKKKAKLEALVASYERCSRRGNTEYARASTHRIGQALIEFGDAIAHSERPAGMSEEDLAAYDEVLAQQSFAFYDRGEDVWSTLLRQAGNATDDPGRWITRTRDALWPRLGERFLFQPEVDYPLVAGAPPAERAQE